MTLTQTIVAPWGVWQSADCRLLDPRTNEIHENSSYKTVQIRCNDGGALITYTAIGRFDFDRDSPDIADWIACQLEGHACTVFEALYRLEESASQEARFRKTHQIFVFGAFAEDKPWIGVIANHEPRVDWFNFPPRNVFQLSTEQVTEAKVIVCGEKRAITESDSELLCTIGLKRPRRSKDFLELLAGVNRRASENKPYGHAISRECAVHFMPPTVDAVIGKFLIGAKMLRGA